jgi:hypothetical protein
MAKRSVSNTQYSLYDAEADLAFYESEVAVILFACGLDGTDVSQYSIDQILDEIAKVYPDNATPFVDNQVMARLFKPGASSFSMKQQLMFTTFLKRAWRNYSLAKTRLENA